MTRTRLWGLYLIIFGALLLLEIHGYIDITLKTVIGSIFVILSIFVFVKRGSYKSKNMLTLLAILLSILGIVLIVDSYYAIADEIMFAAILIAISYYFFRIHFKEPQPAWPVIPGGIFFVFAALSILGTFELLPNPQLWFVFIFGLACTFWYLFFIRDDVNRLKWTLYPSVILTLFSLFILTQTWETRIISLVLPITIIVMGLYLVIKNLYDY